MGQVTKGKVKESLHPGREPAHDNRQALAIITTPNPVSARMPKNKQPARKGPMAIALAAIVALGAAFLGINPDQLRSGNIDGAIEAVEQVSQRVGGHAGADASPVPAAEDPAGYSGGSGDGWAPFLPSEARKTVTLIQQGGPFPYRQDGTTFGNREKRLPPRERGWYREYTVESPGLSHRGPRRIVTGGHPPTEWYYTADHYDSFQSFTPPARTH